MNRPPRGRHSKLSTSSHLLSDHDRLIARLLGDPKKAEAMKWLGSVRTGEERTIGARKTTRASAKLVQRLYDLGSTEVVAAQIHHASKGVGQHTGKLVVKLPKDLEHRRAIFEWCRNQGESLGYSPDSDQGEDYLFLLLD